MYQRYISWVESIEVWWVKRFMGTPRGLVDLIFLPTQYAYGKNEFPKAKGKKIKFPRTKNGLMHVPEVHFVGRKHRGMMGQAFHRNAS